MNLIHNILATDSPIHLGREPMNECEGVQLQCQQCDPFPSNRIIAREDTTFRVVIGPSANPRGYTAITGKRDLLLLMFSWIWVNVEVLMPYISNFAGQAGWGIAWYINEILIPELVVERGRTYTFLVYGGDDPADNSNYHPFYLSSSVNGGRLLNDENQKAVSS